MIEVKIEHSFDFLICIYPNNKEETLSVSCNAHLILTDFHLEIHGKYVFVDLVCLTMKKFPLAYRDCESLHFLLEDLVFLLKIRRVCM